MYISTTLMETFNKGFKDELQDYDSKRINC